MGQFASLISNYEQAKASHIKCLIILNLPEEREKNKAAIHKQDISGDIKFNNVSFAYNENKEEALENISLK